VHRKLLLAAVVLGIVLFTARYASAPQPGPDTTGREIVFTREAEPAPLSAPLSPLTELQNSLDAVSQAAVEADWRKAGQGLQDLQCLWESLRPRSAESLEMERQMGQLLQALQEAVWGQDEQGVLEAAQELTRLVGLLSNQGL
jgi:hypothetical protein